MSTLADSISLEVSYALNAFMYSRDKMKHKTFNKNKQLSSVLSLSLMLRKNVLQKTTPPIALDSLWGRRCCSCFHWGAQPCVTISPHSLWKQASATLSLPLLHHEPLLASCVRVISYPLIPPGPSQNKRATGRGQALATQACQEIIVLHMFQVEANSKQIPWLHIIVTYN